MANKQSKVDSLEEPISKLVAENDILRRENTEIKSENIKLKTENAKLKQALKEHESRFMKLEQNDKDTASENAKLKARVAKLEQKQLQTDKEKSNILYYEVMTAPAPLMPSHLNRMIPPLLKQKILTMLLNRQTYIELSSQYSTSPVCTENKSLKDKEIDEFVDSIYEEQVSKEIIQRIREKKLREQELSSISVEELCSEKVRLKVPLEQNSKSVPIQPEETKVSYDYIVAHPSRNQAQKESIEVIKNKEPDISDHNENDKHIVIELAHLYQKARKAKKNTIYAKQEEILSWYYYAEGFERRVNNNLSICRNNNRADDLARIQVYDEIWDCLSG
ncbi:5174_t:CDS:2, partial [Gigaspora rosea]